MDAPRLAGGIDPGDESHATILVLENRDFVFGGRRMWERGEPGSLLHVAKCVIALFCSSHTSSELISEPIE